MARRFVVNKKDIIDIENGMLEILGDEVKHIQVLRHNVNDEVILNNYRCKIINMKKDSIIVKTIEKLNPFGIPSIDITLFQAYLKSDKMEFVVEKQVELGITKIIPIISKNVVVKMNEDDKQKKIEKLNKKSIEATKQCGRSDIVSVSKIIDINKGNIFYTELNNYDFVIFAYELASKESTLNSVIKSIKKEERFLETDFKIAVVVGAEGGFTLEEAKKISKLNNVYTVTLGERILRAETASIYILSILDYEFNGGF